MTYERAVYAEECDSLCEDIISLCRNAPAENADERARSAIFCAALLSAAQYLDGNKMPEETRIIKKDGIASWMLKCLLDAKER